MESSRLISARAISIDSCSSACPLPSQFAHFALHQLQMDVERIERVADLVRHARREQSQRIETLRFDRLLASSAGSR